MREARARRDLVAGELAAGRDPARRSTIARLRHRGDARSVSGPSVPGAWVDYAAETTKNLSRIEVDPADVRDHDPASITVADVQMWIAGSTLKPRSVRRYLRRFARCSTSPTSIRIPRGTARAASSGGAGSWTRRPPRTSTRSLPNVPPRWRLRYVSLSRAGCASANRRARVGRCRRAGLAVPGEGRQDRRRPTLGR